MDRYVVISGCSGGGKSTLLGELERRGYTVFEEPGRRIIAEERRGSGRALPWVSLSAFAERAIEMSLEDRERAKGVSGMVFFDRGLIDAAATLEYATGKPILKSYSAVCYNPLVFMTPPWPVHRPLAAHGRARSLPRRTRSAHHARFARDRHGTGSPR